MSEAPWFLAYADGATSQEVLTPLFVPPTYPQRMLRPGGCAAGWITYAVVKGTTPTTVVYGLQSDDPSNTAPPLEWTLAIE